LCIFSVQHIRRKAVNLQGESSRAGARMRKKHIEGVRKLRGIREEKDEFVSSDKGGAGEEKY
jgi:hypothetical protein